MSQESHVPSTSRIEAFSDGVLAIVITLLVLELRVPQIEGEPTAQALAAAFAALAPKFVSFIVSFVIVAIFWVNHHQLFHSIRHTDRALLWLNILFLLFISAVPFPTAVIGEYPQNAFAAAFFGSIMLGAGLAFALMRWYASFPGRLIAASPAVLRRAVRRSLLSPALYLLGTLVALVSPAVAVAIYILVPIIFFVPNPLERHRSQGEAQSD